MRRHGPLPRLVVLLAALIAVVSSLVQAPRAGADDVPPARLLREREMGGLRLYVQDGVQPEQLDWVVRGDAVADDLIPRLLGLTAPHASLGLYILADQTEFRTQTSRLTGLPLEAIGRFEAGRSYAYGARRGIYLDGAALTSDALAAHLVGHELVHLAARDAGATELPVWFTEGVAEYVGQAAMAATNADLAAERRWRRSAAAASALHRGELPAPSALSTTSQWSQAAASGNERLLYSVALLAVDWLASAPGADRVLARTLDGVARHASFAQALEAAGGPPADALDARLLAALRGDLPVRFPVGVHVRPADGLPGTRFQFAAVGLAPDERLLKQFVRADGHPARDQGAPSVVGPTGAAFWTFQTRADSLPSDWTLTVEGDRGTRFTVPFRVTEPAANP